MNKRQSSFKISRQWILRTLVVWLFEVLGLAVMIYLLPGVTAASWAEGAAFIAVVGLLNTFLWPFLSRLTLRFIVYTLGFGALLLNALLLQLGSLIIKGVNFSSLWDTILVSLSLTAVNMIISSLLTIDDEGSFYRHQLKRQLKRTQKNESLRPYPGVLFIELDGFSEPALQNALKQGLMPNVARWLKSGSHHLLAWETDTSCQTAASQAGILHGNNDNIPAFRWVDKSNHNLLVSASDPQVLPKIEQRISNGKGLLSDHGYSRINMFSGDAQEAMMTMSRITGLAKVYTPSFYTFFSNPYNVIRTLILYVMDIMREYRSRWRQKRQNVWPRLGKEKRGGVHPFKRAAVTVIMHELLSHTLLGDIFLGEADAVYATFVGYDELAHYCGPNDPDTLNWLTRMDRDIGRLEQAIKEADRPYVLALLSDHGQTKGATFKQRYHLTLEDYIKQLLPAKTTLQSQMDTDESWNQINAALTDMASDDKHLSGKMTRRLTKKYQQNGTVVVGPESSANQLDKTTQSVDQKAQVTVLASGNLGLVYFTNWHERLDLETINMHFPNLIQKLCDHEGIGFIMVNSKEHGAIVLGKKGKYYLKNAQIVGENPLKNFRPHTAKHLKRTNGFKNVPDILVNSFYDPQKDEGAAFEEQISFHGGFGGGQAKPFLLIPKAWKAPSSQIVGAEQVHQFLKSQLNTLRNSPFKQS